MPKQALLRLRAGDRAGYRTTCQKLLEAFAQTRSAAAANNVAWACVLVPEAGVDIAQVVALAERVVETAPRPVYLNTLGAALYRAGQDDAAIATLKPSGPWNLLFLAMAHHRLGRTDKAREYFEQAIPQMKRFANFSWPALESTKLRNCRRSFPASTMR